MKVISGEGLTVKDEKLEDQRSKKHVSIFNVECMCLCRVKGQGLKVKYGYKGKSSRAILWRY